MLAQRLSATLQSLENAAIAAHRPVPRLLAVSKTQTAAAIAALAAAGQHAFGENYVQEAQAKIGELAAQELEWHLVGHLQSNKAELAANLFDWVQTVDRTKLVAALARFRPGDRAPLNVLIQVNIDDEASKHGCDPRDIPGLATAIAAEPRLVLRGLMAIPAPHPDIEMRRAAYRRMAGLFADLATRHPQADTLSMGMSDDFPLAVAEGATMVRIGTALFGSRATTS
ncbi:YggS family pyridoxal phosphate-dependent enzyme [Pseudoxanthomonas yeongjuensis]|uniref:YggS family pyridoxal phosphate-dependent enzyme n=1 Tax=Pseudoxanthomonas yeongjuensis TaxID=377616 RepID=UPI001391BCD4|nr:YggS family pyridoxal phosphate-dependent enzyme [Pseudoxanthomonas yeongjuensis]KAF1718534.1 YggS family pyridoxal phosphate-dependent enzyme [Pseudoxanthomonas yeongjuensis]